MKCSVDVAERLSGRGELLWRLSLKGAKVTNLRVLIAGGGTGGHIIPALAVAHELVERHAAEVLFVGTARGMEIRLVPEAGFNLRLIDVGPLKNVSLLTRLRTLHGGGAAAQDFGHGLRAQRHAGAGQPPGGQAGAGRGRQLSLGGQVV